MKFRYLAALLLVIAVAVPLSSQRARQKASRPKSVGIVERGRYLVESSALCTDCHNPRNDKGEYVKEQWLMGAPVMFKPTVEIPWAERAPRIAGLPGWSDEAAVKFLMTGETNTGTPPRPPMPPYRFNRQDAEAIVAYLRSLKSESSTAENMAEKR